MSFFFFPKPKHRTKGSTLNAFKMFPDLARVIHCEHIRVGLTASGHDFDHDLRVANYALLIAPDSYTGTLAAAAGFCHSADHLLKKELGRKPKRAETEKYLTQLINYTDCLSAVEDEEVIRAVIEHDSVNKETDSPVQITLKDADRLANLDADVIIRSGQFQPHLLAVDPVHLENDPGATYRDPRSVLWDVNNCISWMNEDGPYVLRLPKARELGKSRAKFLRLFVETIRTQRTEAGLIPYPVL